MCPFGFYQFLCIKKIIFFLCRVKLKKFKQKPQKLSFGTKMAQLLSLYGTVWRSPTFFSPRIKTVTSFCSNILILQLYALQTNLDFKKKEIRKKGIFIVKIKKKRQTTHSQMRKNYTERRKICCNYLKMNRKRSQ